MKLFDTVPKKHLPVDFDDLEVTSAQKHTAGLLEAPPAMVIEIGEWVQAVAAANRLEVLKEELKSAQGYADILRKSYTELREAIAILRKEYAKGTARSLFTAAKDVWEYSIGSFGYGYANEPSFKSFQKLDADTRQKLIDNLENGCQHLEDTMEKRINSPHAINKAEREIQENREYLRPGVQPVDGSVTQEFRMDLTGWKYAQNKDLLKTLLDKELPYLKKLWGTTPQSLLDDPSETTQFLLKKMQEKLDKANNGQGKWSSINVQLTTKPSIERALGWWQELTMTLAVVIPERVEPHNITESLMKTLRHELQHMAQSLLREAMTDISSYTDHRKKERIPSPGMPSRHIMTPKHLQEENRKDAPTRRWNDPNPSSAETHALDDVEFYTVLSDEIQQARRFLNQAIESRRRDYKLEIPVEEQKNFLLWFIKASNKEPSFYVPKDFSAFAVWKKHAPGKYRKAVGEFYKAFPVLSESTPTAKRVAARYLDAGLLEAPPAMVKAITEWVSAVWALEALGPMKKNLLNAQSTLEDLGEGKSKVLAYGKSLKDAMAKEETHEIDTYFTYLGNYLPYNYSYLPKVPTPSRDNLTDDVVDKWVSSNLAAFAKTVVEYENAVSKIQIRVDKLESYTKPGVSKGVQTKKFPLDLAGWRYSTPKLKAALALADLDEISVKLKDLPHGVGGMWVSDSKTLFLQTSGDIHELANIVRHELQHTAQSLLDVSIPKGHGGLPSKSIRTPQYQQEMDRDYQNHLYNSGIGAHELHTLDDSEFYPVLMDLINDARRQLEHQPQAGRKKFLMQFLGIERSFSGPNLAIETMKKYAPGKYRKAVQEFYKAFPILSESTPTAKRVAARWIGRLVK